MIQKNKKYTVTGEYLAELTAEPCIVKRINKMNAIVDDPLQGNWPEHLEEEWYTGPLEDSDPTYDVDRQNEQYWRNR